MQNFVVEKRINLTFAKFTLEIGDMLALNKKAVNNLAVYRNQKLVITLTFTPGRIASLAEEGFIKAPVVETPKPAPAQEIPAPTPEPVVPEAPVVEETPAPEVPAEAPTNPEQEIATDPAGDSLISEPTDEPTESTPALTEMTKKQLLAHALETHDLKIDPSKNKTDILDAINQHVASQTEGAATTE